MFCQPLLSKKIKKNLTQGDQYGGNVGITAFSPGSEEVWLMSKELFIEIQKTCREVFVEIGVKVFQSGEIPVNY